MTATNKNKKLKATEVSINRGLVKLCYIHFKEYHNNAFTVKKKKVFKLFLPINMMADADFFSIKIYEKLLK